MPFKFVAEFVYLVGADGRKGCVISCELFVYLQNKVRFFFYDPKNNFYLKNCLLYRSLYRIVTCDAWVSQLLGFGFAASYANKTP